MIGAILILIGIVFTGLLALWVTFWLLLEEEYVYCFACIILILIVCGMILEGVGI